MAFPKKLPENEKEVNQLAKHALAQAGVKPAVAKLYWLQLVRWALNSGRLIGYNHHLLLFLELLEGSDPKTTMNFFEGRKLGLTAQKEWDPVDLARLLLIHLDCCMTEKVEGYSRIHTPESASAASAEESQIA